MMGMPGMGGAVGAIGASAGASAGVSNRQTVQAPTTPTQQPTASPTQTTSAQAQPTMAPMGTAVGQPTLTATVPKGFNMSPGQAMWGTVTGQQGGFYTLQFGRFSLTARTNMPLMPGQRIQVSFQGIKGGQIELQLLKSATYSKITTTDLATTLARMNQPTDNKNIQVAKGMVEYGIPLTAKNFAEVTKALAQLPGGISTTDFAACSFLKMCNLPLTAQNVAILSDFIARNPMLGAQLFELQYYFDKDLKKVRSNLDSDILRDIEELQGLIGNYVVDPSKQNQQRIKKNLKNLARESGIERTEYRGGARDNEEEWELLKIARKIQSADVSRLGEKGAVLKKAAEIVRDVELNLYAQQIINSGKPTSDIAFYYMQIPVKLDNETVTAEVRMKYYDEEAGRVIDPENTKIEFDVTTERLGEMHFSLSVNKGVIDLDVGTGMDEVNEFVKRFVPTLKEKLEKIGYSVSRIRSETMSEISRPSLVKREAFETIEKVNVQA